MSHTPGPWIFIIDEDEALVFVDDRLPGRLVIAEVSDQPETEANAQLIAAAPDLLAAVKRAYEIETSTTQGHERDLRQGYNAMLRAAIARAEGRS